MSMKTLRWTMVLGSFGIAPVAWGQDSPKPETSTSTTSDRKSEDARPTGEVKSADSPKSSEKDSTAWRNVTDRAKQDLEAAKLATTKAQAEAKRVQDEARKAQEAFQRAQGDFMKAQVKAQRAQGEAQRALNKAQSDQNRRVFGYQTRSLADDKANPGARRMEFIRPNNFAQTFGLDFGPADDSLQAQLELPKDEGLVVLNVTPEGPADKVGIKRFDVILKLDQKSVHDVPEARRIIEDRGQAKVVINLKRAGKPVEVTMTKPEPPASKEPYYLGVVLSPVDATLRAQLPALPDDSGLIVTEVTPNSPASKAEARKYDIVFKIDDKPLKDNAALIEQVQKTKGEPVKVAILRAGETKTLTITPERRPANSTFRVDATFNPNQVFEALKAEQGKNGPMYFTWTPGSNIGGWASGSDKTPDFPSLGAMTINGADVSKEVRDEMEKQVKDLAKQMEDLQKAIEAMNKSMKQKPPVEVKDVKEKDEK